jgi:hypothetical protein
VEGSGRFHRSLPRICGDRQKYRSALSVYEEAKVKYRGCVTDVIDRAVHDIQSGTSTCGPQAKHRSRHCRQAIARYEAETG